jgi:hypothetical protein
MLESNATLTIQQMTWNLVTTFDENQMTYRLHESTYTTNL